MFSERIIILAYLSAAASFSVSLFAAKKRKEDKLYDRFKGKKELNRTKKSPNFLSSDFRIEYKIFIVKFVVIY